MRTTSAVCCVAICSFLFVLSPAGGLAPAAAQSEAVAKYHCPMHPSYVSDHKGDCPVCGMKLTPVKGAASAARAEPQPAADKPSAPAAGAVSVSAEKQKVLGMVLASVERSGGARTLRALGRVAPDETRLYKLNAGTMGSVRDVSAVTAGSRVRKNQILGSYYAPEILSVLQLFILNTQGYDRRAAASAYDMSAHGEGKGEDENDVRKKNSSIYNANIQQRIMQLENYGVSAMQRQEIMSAGKVPDTIKVVAPCDGVVLARNVYPGLKFDRGFEFYRIADLRKVWVVADVFPQDAQHVSVGMRAEVSVPERGTTLRATVTEILPQFDAATRTLKVKLTVDNPGLVLRPDMFVDVSVKIDLPQAVVVPADAVIDSGLAKRVFVQTADGVFEPRAVQTGWRSADRVEVTKGLRPGDVVVASGTFFLDSETRMRPTTSGAAVALEPVPTGSRSRGGAGAVTEARADEVHRAHRGDAR